jgi:hypothetical protein
MADQGAANLALMCDQTATCAVADVAKVEEGQPYKNTLQVFRKMRIQILDCRSYAPLVGIPVEGVWIADYDGGNHSPLARYKASQREWDISKNIPIWPADKKHRYMGEKKPSNLVSIVKASQIALNALGFNTGNPGNSYGPQGRTAYLKYRILRKQVFMKMQDLLQTEILTNEVLDKKLIETKAGNHVLKDITDDSGNEITVNEPDTAACEGILKEYNTRCYRGAQFHLAALGFYPPGPDPLSDFCFDETEGGEWTKEWKEAFGRWKKKVGLIGKKCSWEWVQTKDVGKLLMESAKPFVTDSNGILNIPIPIARMNKGFRIEIGFADFALVPEATLREYKANPAATIHRSRDVPNLTAGRVPRPQPGALWQQKILWIGPQSVDRQSHWGWWLEHSLLDGQHRRREFMSTLEFVVPPFAADKEEDFTWKKLHKKNEALSLFYDASADTPEFVAYAMVWCQPVYDEFGDAIPTTGSPAVTDNTYSWWPNSSEECNLHMHIVTQFYDLAGWKLFGGKGYGLFEHNPPGQVGKWRGKRGHHGLDLHAAIGAPCFAVHGGLLKWKDGKKDRTGDAGNIAQLSWLSPPGKCGFMGYLHCEKQSGNTPRHVRAGEIIAFAGRTGNLSAISDQAGHTHIIVGMRGNLLRETPDDANKVCIPFNERTSLLFPCKCQTTQGDDQLRNCNFGNIEITGIPQSAWKGKLASVCWAVAELVCPHMPRTINIASLEDATEEAIKARRRIQAQLRYLSYFDLLPDSKPSQVCSLSRKQKGSLDGDFGNYKDLDMLTTKSQANFRSGKSTQSKKVWQAPAGTQLKKLSQDGDFYLIEIPTAERSEAGCDSAWIHKSVVEVKLLGKTRDAIYRFKQANNLLPALPTVPTPEQMYTIDKNTLDKLDELAPLIPVSVPPK